MYDAFEIYKNNPEGRSSIQQNLNNPACDFALQASSCQYRVANLAVHTDRGFKELH